MIKTKRSQAEIVGITIVMILIMLGIVFVIKFVVLDEEIDIKKSYDDAITPANFIDTVLRTTTTCNRQELKELIYDCIENYGYLSFQYNCSTDNICTNPNGCTSCEYVNQTLKYMLNNSLDMMRTNYDLFICEWDEISSPPRCKTFDPNNPGQVNISEKIITYFSFSSCLVEGESYESKQTPLPALSGAGNMVVVMYIC